MRPQHNDTAHYWATCTYTLHAHPSLPTTLDQGHHSLRGSGVSGLANCPIPFPPPAIPRYPLCRTMLLTSAPLPFGLLVLYLLLLHLKKEARPYNSRCPYGELLGLEHVSCNPFGYGARQHMRPNQVGFVFSELTACLHLAMAPASTCAQTGFVFSELCHARGHRRSLLPFCP